MNDIKIKLRCVYCNDYIKSYIEPFNDKDIRLLNLLVKDSTQLCKKCANTKEARIWLTNYIMNK